MDTAGRLDQRGTVTGWMKARLQRLLVHDINLYAYHLPLDAHAELGNNAQLGRRLGFVPDEGGWQRFGEQQLGFLGAWEGSHAQALADHVQRVPVVVEHAHAKAVRAPARDRLPDAAHAQNA